MNKKQLQSIYDIINKRDNYLNSFYKLVDMDKELPFELYDFIVHTQLEDNEENRLASINRFIGLRNDNLVIAWKKDGKTEEEIENLTKIAFAKTSIFHIVKNKKLLDDILKLEIPNFYKKLFEANLDIGCLMTDVHIEWCDTILKFNKELIKSKGSISESIKFLKDNNLFETQNGKFTDRSYSCIVPNDDKFVMKTFKDCLPSVPILIDNIEKHVTILSKVLSDDLYDDKSEEYMYVQYLKSLSNAFNESDVDKSFKKWVQVDIEWMKLTGPIQFTHPFEFYDDKLRNAVSIEFDIRVKHPDTLDNNTGNEVKSISNNYFDKNENKNIRNIVNSNIDKVQLHIGKQMFYSGSQFDGLASAQVIPNDEDVSEKYGKKIFAFLDKNLELALTKPKLKISRIVIGKEIEDKIDDLINNRPDDFSKIYDITTIGHEYGHILWKDMDTEVIMNDSGNFKNIEEFKASSGGIVSFINSKHFEEFQEDVLINTLKRAIRLIEWKKVPEVEAYYCEGLITLDILFNSGVFKFNNNKLIIDISKSTSDIFYEKYSKVYYKLVESYLKKESANNFLFNYVQNDEDNDFIPKNENVKNFTKYYYELYLNIGNEVL